jgi:hypothetical protein
MAGYFHNLTIREDCDEMYNLLQFNGDFFQALLRLHRVWRHFGHGSVDISSRARRYQYDVLDIPNTDGSADILQVSRAMFACTIAAPAGGMASARAPLLRLS